MNRAAPLPVVAAMFGHNEVKFAKKAMVLGKVMAVPLQMMPMAVTLRVMMIFVMAVTLRVMMAFETMTLGRMSMRLVVGMAKFVMVSSVVKPLTANLHACAIADWLKVIQSHRNQGALRYFARKNALIGPQHDHHCCTEFNEAAHHRSSF